MKLERTAKVGWRQHTRKSPEGVTGSIARDANGNYKAKAPAGRPASE